MRVLFLLVFIAGAALGLGYPWAVLHFAGHQLGILRVYDRPTGYRPVEIHLSPSEAPVRVLVDLRVVGGTRLLDGKSVVNLTVTSGGRSILAVPLTFGEATLVDRSPQTNERIYRDDAGLISTVEEGIYTFSVQPGEETGIYIQSVDVILRADALRINEVVRVGGFLLMAAAAIGLAYAIARHRRRRWEETASEAGKPDEN